MTNAIDTNLAIDDVEGAAVLLQSAADATRGMTFQVPEAKRYHEIEARIKKSLKSIRECTFREAQS